jgi:hypothetical protein
MGAKRLLQEQYDKAFELRRQTVKESVK